MIKIYLVEHCPCIHESEFGVVSIHLTKEAAVKSMAKVRGEEYNQLVSIELNSLFMNKEEWDCAETRMNQIVRFSDQEAYRYRIMWIE